LELPLEIAVAFRCFACGQLGHINFCVVMMMIPRLAHLLYSTAPNTHAHKPALDASIKEKADNSGGGGGSGTLLWFGLIFI